VSSQVRQAIRACICLGLPVDERMARQDAQFRLRLFMFQTVFLCSILAFGQIDSPASAVIEQTGNPNCEPACAVCQEPPDRFLKRFAKVYVDDVRNTKLFGSQTEGEEKSVNGNGNGDGEQEPEYRRGLPAPFPSPPFPSSEYLMVYPIGVLSDETFPLMQAIYDGPNGQRWKDNRIKVYGWVDTSINASTSTDNNLPNAFNIRANTLTLQQALMRIERIPDTVQTDHWDWGFKIDQFYGLDYRYTTARGIFSDQLIKYNQLYGYDPVQFYGQLYVPNIGQGTLFRVGRFILLPGIEADLAVDNYMFTHTVLYTYFPYTHMGVLGTTMLNDQWQVQYGLTAGSDIAIWDSARELTPITGIRWVSKNNKDSIYLCTISNSGMFSYNNVQMLPDIVWTHKFNDQVHMLTEAYYCYQWNVPAFTSFGKDNLPRTRSGYVRWYGVSNYFEVQISKKSYVTFRNEGLRDEQGQRTGFATWYSTHTLGLVHKPYPWLILRPEVKFSHSYNANAYNQPDTLLTGSQGPGTRQHQVEATFDFIFRF
jgi:hypothetical protein